MNGQLTLDQEWPSIIQTEVPIESVVTENDMPEPIVEVQERHKSQRETILELLESMDFVPTELIVSKNIYQYNARIQQLRREGYIIDSCRENGRYGFRLN